MGYQLPGLGNVAFPGFGALGKQQSRDTARSKKLGKDQPRQGISRSVSTPSSPSSSLPAVAPRPSCERKLLEKGFLQRWRQELRPLLNSIRFVEASHRESSNDGTSRIGPFQISRQYHQDAWKHSPPMAWSRCRDLNHAENTVIAYWFKYCPEALERHDFEILAKIHKGSFSSDSCRSQDKPFSFDYLMRSLTYGIQGMQREDENGYWYNISQHLKQQETEGTKRDTPTWSFFSTERHVKQDLPGKVSKKTTAVLSPINSNTLSSSRTPKPSLRTPKPASCAAQPKQQIPLIQTLKPKLFRRALLTEEKTSGVNLCSSGARPGSTVREATSCKKAANKRLRQTSYYQLNNSTNPISLGYAFNLASFCNSSRAERLEKAAIFVQALWRMQCVRRKYIRMRNAAILIQQSWRNYLSAFSCQQKVQREPEGLNCTASPYFKATPVCAEKQGYLKPNGSPCELLYRGDISPNQEDELLTELVSLLNLDVHSPSVESCDSFRFPRSLDEATEACTPKMKSDSRDSLFCLPGVSAEKRAAEPDSQSLISVEETPLVIKQALLSPVMEKEIIAELAKLFPLCKGNSQENLASSSSLSLTGSGQSLKTMDSKLSILQEQHEREGIIRRLTFNTTEVEEDRMNIANAAVANVSTSEREGEPSVTRFSLHSSLKHSNNRGYDKELDDFNIPLLVDQSPLLKSRRCVRYQNPCNRKIEKEVVSSFSDWRYSFSSVQDYKDHEAFKEGPQEEDHEAFKEGPQVDCSADALCSLISCMEIVTSKEFCLSSLTKSSSMQERPSQFATLTRRISGGDSCRKTHVSVDTFSDCLLETCDVKSSMVYAKAIFQFPKFPQNDDEKGILFEKSHNRHDAAARRGNSGYCPAITSSTRLASLHHVCMLWDVLNVDLLTRTLKYKSLQAVQQQDLLMQAADNVAADIQLELDYLEALPKKLEEESKRKELVRHQRDIIYTNIAAFYDVQERQRLYDKWEIQKLLTGRLKKIVYELLWIDPQRYQESAELVIHNL